MMEPAFAGIDCHAGHTPLIRLCELTGRERGSTMTASKETNAIAQLLAVS
jgi:hypothetical protein